jgi:hypothetical protein
LAADVSDAGHHLEARPDGDGESLESIPARRLARLRRRAGGEGTDCGEDGRHEGANRAEDRGYRDGDLEPRREVVLGSIQPWSLPRAPLKA